MGLASSKVIIYLPIKLDPHGGILKHRWIIIKLHITMTIITSTITDLKSNWKIEITDRTAPETRFHKNPNKINYLQNSKQCNFVGCTNTFRVNRTSGLCNIHEMHKHSLFLELYDYNGTLINAP